MNLNPLQLERLSQLNITVWKERNATEWDDSVKENASPLETISANSWDFLYQKNSQYPYLFLLNGNASFHDLVVLEDVMLSLNVGREQYAILSTKSSQAFETSMRLLQNFDMEQFQTQSLINIKSTRLVFFVDESFEKCHLQQNANMSVLFCSSKHFCVGAEKRKLWKILADYLK